MTVGDKRPKQSLIKVLQFASKFVGYNHFASVLRVKGAYFQVQLHFALPDRNFFRFFNFENTVNFSMDSTAKFSDIRFSISPGKIVQSLSKTSCSSNFLHLNISEQLTVFSFSGSFFTVNGVMFVYRDNEPVLGRI